MSWYDEDQPHRRAISIDNSLAAGTVDVEITIPPEDELFWGSVQSDGDDVRVTDADGVTLLSYELTTWTYATRTAVLAIDALSIQATAGVYKASLYFGDAAAADASTTVTITSAVAGYIEQGSPRGAVYLVTAGPQPRNSTQPTVQLQKGADEIIVVWWRVDGILQRRPDEYEGRLLHEEMYGAQFAIETGGTPQASMIEQASQRFVEIAIASERRQYVVMKAKAGTDGTDYTAILDVLTMIPTQAQYLQHQPRAFLAVVDVDEA